MPNCADCQNEYRIKQLEEDSKRNSDTHQKFFDRFEVIGKEQVKTETTYATILEKLANLETKVDSLMCKPTKRWDAIVAAAISALVAAAITCFIKGGA
jgi:hypothetical protein